MLSLKKKIKIKNLPGKLRIYIKWTTKFKTLTASIKNTGPSLGIPHTHIKYNVMSAASEPYSNKIIQGTMVACFPFQLIKQAINRAYLVDAQIYV